MRVIEDKKLISLGMIVQVGKYIYEHFIKKQVKKKKPFNRFERDGNSHAYVLLSAVPFLFFIILTYLRLYEKLVLRFHHVGICYVLGIISGVGLILLIKTSIKNKRVDEAFKLQGELVKKAKKKAEKEMDRIDELTK